MFLTRSKASLNHKDMLVDSNPIERKPTEHMSGREE